MSIPVTKYEKMSNQDLAKHFHRNNWSKIEDIEKKRELIQEMVNRESAILGRDTYPTATLQEFASTTAGTYDSESDTIQINKDLVDKGTMTISLKNDKGEIQQVEYFFPNSNLLILETTAHESYHGYQNDVAYDKIEESFSAERELCKASLDAYCCPPEEKGVYANNNDPNLYYLQYLERSANAYANERVNQANNLMASDPDLGPDPGIKAYNEAFARSYENALEEVRDKYLLDNNPIRAIDEAQYKEANGLSDNRTTQELLEDQATFRAQQMEEHLNSHFVEAKHHSLNGQSEQSATAPNQETSVSAESQVERQEEQTQEMSY